MYAFMCTTLLFALLALVVVMLSARKTRVKQTTSAERAPNQRKMRMNKVSRQAKRFRPTLRPTKIVIAAEHLVFTSYRGQCSSPAIPPDISFRRILKLPKAPPIHGLRGFFVPGEPRIACTSYMSLACDQAYGFSHSPAASCSLAEFL